jgi:hypothetical protein
VFLFLLPPLLYPAALFTYPMSALVSMPYSSCPSRPPFQALRD